MIARTYNKRKKWALIAKMQIPGRDVGANMVWGRTQGEGVNVAVIDNGIMYDHPGLKKKVQVLAPGEKNSGEHATQCAGIIAADGLLKGVAPKSKLLSINVLESDLSFESFKKSIEKAIENSAKVINVSRLFYAPKDYSLRQTINKILNDNCLICVCAGNDENDDNDLADFLHGLDNVIVVGAKNKKIGNPKIDIYAPGNKKILTTSTQKGGISNFGLTSAATAFVSGTAALLFSLRPGIKAQEVKNIIISSSKEFPKSTKKYGRVNVRTLNVEIVLGSVK